MTTAAANSFHEVQSDHKVSETARTVLPDSVTTASQLSTVLRTGNLSEWLPRRADVALSPTSCLDIYQRLVLNSLPMKLMPARTPGIDESRALTLHAPAQLALRCRKLEVETSLSSQPAQYKLYLAAGFLVQQVQGKTKRQPILLVPVNIRRTRGRGSEYAISYVPGKPLHINPALGALCNKPLDEQIKAFTSRGDLRSFLKTFKRNLHSHVVSKISANSGLISLQAGVLTEYSDAELVSADLDATKPGIGYHPMPELPKSFDSHLAMRLLRFIDRDDLPAALHSFAGTEPKSDLSLPLLDLQPDLEAPQQEKYYKCAGWMVDVGLGHWQLKNIAALPKRVGKMVRSINELLSHPLYKLHIPKEHHNIDMVLRLNRVRTRITHAPLEMKHQSIGQHTDPHTRLLLQKAKIQASSLQAEMKEIRETFHLDAIPSSKALHHLIKTISGREDEAQLTNPAYFRARRQLNEVLRNPNGVLTENELQRLDKLAKTLRFSELFESDVYYKRAFGPLFRGTDTNWQRLDSIVDYTHSLSAALGSPALVGQFTNHWASFERDFEELAPILETAAIAAYQLCALIPMFIDHDTTLENAASTGSKFQIRVDQWQGYMRRYYADLKLTPYQFLSTMDLGDHSHPTVGLSQKEFDERIYRHIVGAGLSDETIAATAEWLVNVTQRLDIDVPSVRRYLDKEAAVLAAAHAA